MKTIDNRFDVDLFKSFIGKKLAKIKHDHFRATNTITGIVGFMVETESFAMINDYEEIDYLGWDNEACVCRIIKKPWDDIYSFLVGNEQIATEIDEVIRSISLVNDHIRSYVDGLQNYDLWETRAVIFYLDTYQISFTKQVCFFSMEIEVNRGCNLISKIETTDEFYDEDCLSDGQTLMIDREVLAYSNESTEL